MNPSDPLNLQPSLRTLETGALQSLHHHSHDVPLHHHPQFTTGLQGLDASGVAPNAALFQQRYHLGGPALHPTSSFGRSGLQALQVQQGIPTSEYQNNGGLFGIIGAPPARGAHIGIPQRNPRVQTQTQDLRVSPQNEDGQQLHDNQGLCETAVQNSGQFEGLKLIPNPSNLEEWRERLFHVNDTIILTEDEFQTYFPHIDNVYSHRSTQRHKRKRFVSHYWDCRLKGRPPGTKKSTDPEKKKRKRVARERDLCDVKIKITEYSDPAEFTEQTGQQPPRKNTGGDPFPGSVGSQRLGAWGLSGQGTNIAMGQAAGAAQKKIYTMQRVNGNGGNGKGDGVAGPHKHTLEESDRVKKNSVMRWMMKNGKEIIGKKKVVQKTYHKKATGEALTTVKNHSKEEDLILYGSCFCPFVQRVWISLEMKGIPYQYIEVDPYKKPQSLLDVNPRGLVPAIRHGPTWSVHESIVIMEYLEDLQQGPPLLPPNPKTRATSRLWSDHVNRNIIPGFYHLLQAQDADKQVQHAEELRNEIAKLVNAADPTGPFFLGQQMSFVDVQIAPWVLRLKRVLGPYRGWPEPERGSRWAKWVEAVEGEQSVRATTSNDELYLDSYERYAENRPNTSQLADAVNSGRGLP
ncbi:hypothetical protein GQ43DRAFT_444542 [Delitschia confertaspora ATCC 74209]|uniref:Glutathione transferase n=1 Tax=Delitschia confertaspora ATCC 74209 TaxID=1513339 RepID=A0A9P4JD17_9PLEO|nr:hypothetical protein GQ43DRAFT_444542 [Delitschia confertaspora ATCC 74209]